MPKTSLNPMLVVTPSMMIKNPIYAQDEKFADHKQNKIIKKVKVKNSATTDSNRNNINY